MIRTLVIFALLLTGCSDEDPTEARAGRVIVGDGVTLTLSPGAVPDEVAVWIETLSAADEPRAVRLMPAGLRLAAPAELCFAVSGETSLRQRADAESPWTTLPSKIAGDHLCAALEAFDDIGLPALPGLEAAPFRVSSPSLTVPVDFLDVADTEPDGFDDVLVKAGGIATLWRGRGDGRFVRRPGELASVLWCRLNRHGDVLVVRQEGPIELVFYRHDNVGFFESSRVSFAPGFVTGFAWGDIDGDGDDDLVGRIRPADFAQAPALFLLVNHGGGRFEATHVPLPEPVRSLFLLEAAADLDGDGRAELLIAAATVEGSSRYRRDGATGEWSVWEGPAGIAAFDDLDGDGDLDGVGAIGDFLIVYANDGAGGFTELVRAPLEGARAPLAIADFDGDGDHDVFAGGEGESLALFAFDAAGLTRHALSPWPGAGEITSARVIDANTDGHPDVIAATTGGRDTVRLWINDGDLP
jgi:FG-GAP-like repeat